MKLNENFIQNLTPNQLFIGCKESCKWLIYCETVFPLSVKSLFSILVELLRIVGYILYEVVVYFPANSRDLNPGILNSCS
jgi:hypothetical protein